MLRLDDEFPTFTPERREGEEQPEPMEEQPVVDTRSSGLSVVHNIKDRNKGVGLRL